MKASQLFREQFRFTTNRHREAEYYRQPLRDSRQFRNNTITMICALSSGVLLLILRWAALRPSSRILVAISLVCLLGVWVRTILDHTRMQEWLANTPQQNTPEELLREAAGGANFGPSVLYMVALALILALLFTLSRGS